jgi:geranylgeranyl diphosphate synthase, type II
MICFDELQKIFSRKLTEEVGRIGNSDPKNLYDPIRYSLEMGGKRIRPILLLMAYEFYCSDIDKALPVAVAVELFHNFTLLHDDIMDNADLRRNRETVHVKYSDNAAILSGDAMSILSYAYVLKCETPKLKEILDVFTDTALKVCEGQQLDMDFETIDHVSVDDYMEMIGLKTAILLASSLKMGAMIAEAPSEDINSLFEFGYNLGMAFQLQDDYLDTFGDTETFGKNIGGDIVSNKKTFLLSKAIDVAKDSSASSLKNWISMENFNREEKIVQVKAIFVKLGVDKYAKSMIEEYYIKAEKCWDMIDVDLEKKQELLNIAQQLMNRKS